MKLSNLMRGLLIGALATGLVALAGCTVKGGTGEPAPASRDTGGVATTDDGPEAEIPTVSTAMVAYVNGDDVLFIDQGTDTPYIPTRIDDATITLDGQEIDEDDLVAGNIVEVTGNGIMLESFPGQYPGITAIKVTEQGSPVDAERYAELVSSIFASPDQSQVPTGNVDYKTDQAQVSVMLNPYDFEWKWETDDGNESTAQADGFAADGNGVVNENLGDARISGRTDAVAAFSVNPTSIEIERTPLVASDPASIDPTAESQDVPCTLGEDGAVAFSIEPGYLYEIDATFPQGDADYAFYTIG